MSLESRARLDAALIRRIEALERAAAAGSAIVGEVRTFTGESPPPRWLTCDGSAVSRNDYSSLFAVIGTSFGEGNGSTTFNLPNLVDRFVIGSGTRPIGTEGGSADAVLVEHHHSVNPPNTATSSDTHDHSVNPPNTATSSDTHDHSVNPPSTATSSDTHSHSLSAPALFHSGVSTSLWVDTDSPNIALGSFSATNGDTHSHTLDIAAFNSGSDAHSHTLDIAAFNSGSDAHSHTLDIAPFNSEAAGISGDEANLPPFTALSHIIYAGN